MNTFSKLTVVFVAIAGLTYLVTGPNESTLPAWKAVVENIGPGYWIYTAEDRPCYYYSKDDQLICYHVFETWYGVDAKPVSLNHKPL